MMLNRTVCDVLREMRTAHETNNYSYLLGLIEEVQSMANRMEAGLWDQTEVDGLRKEHSKLKQDINNLEQKKSKLKRDMRK